MIIFDKNALSGTARRAGWVGCNISLKEIPQTGKIYYIKNQKPELKSKILDDWQKTLFLRDEKKLSVKGWVLDVMNCIDKIGKKEFTLDEAYAFEKILEERHPNNKHIKDKIRQQLQLLRDKGYLSFIERGKYRIR